MSATGTYLDVPDDAVLRVAPGSARTRTSSPAGSGRCSRTTGASRAHGRRPRAHIESLSASEATARGYERAIDETLALVRDPHTRPWRSGGSRWRTSASTSRISRGSGWTTRGRWRDFRRNAIGTSKARGGPLLDSPRSPRPDRRIHPKEPRHRRCAERHRTHVRVAAPAPAARIRELCAYREILLNLIRKELKVKYTASVLGAIWSVLNPIVFLAVFTFVVKVLGNSTPALPGVPAVGPARLEPVLRRARQRRRGRVIDNANLVKKVAFPREILRCRWWASRSSTSCCSRPCCCSSSS